jgi:hypothetical protein
LVSTSRPLNVAALQSTPVGAVAAVLLLAAAGAWFAVFNRQRPAPEPQTREIPATAAELRTELDLRKYAVVRSQEKADERPPVSLPAGV